MTTPAEVFGGYRPAAHMVPPPVWKIVRPVAVQACVAADYTSVASALAVMSTVTHFLAWAYRQDIPLDLESVFVPALVERYCTTQLQDRASETRATRRGYLRRVGRACTAHAPWPPEPKPFADNCALRPPYTAAEVEGFWRAADAQRTPHRIRVATVILTLGLGAGLKAGEMLSINSADHVRIHPADPRLMVIMLPDRTVPVVATYTDRLRELCRRHPEGPLIGHYKAHAKYPLGNVRANLEFPDWLPAFRPATLRTTWMATVLSQDLRISEFMHIAGTVSAKSLEAIAPYVPGRWDKETYLFKGAGL